jgi:hypothetical protein
MSLPDRNTRRARLLWPLIGILVAFAAVALVIALAISQGGARATGGGAAAPSAADSPEPRSDGAVRLAVVGDSISHGDSPDFAAGVLGEYSWVRWAVDDRLVFAGGWARVGALTEEMAANVQRYDADVLVVLAGTNDLAFGVQPEATAVNLVNIAETAGVPRVVLVGIPPNDVGGLAVTRYNAALKRLADSRGWEFVDASAELRAEQNTYREGLSVDGVHPTVQGAKLLAAAVRAHVLG